MIKTQRDFLDDTAWERSILAFAVPVIPLVSYPAGLDLCTGNVTIVSQSGTMVGGQDRLLRDSLLPLLFGAGWKVIDLALELDFAGAGLTPQNSNRWTIEKKKRLAASAQGGSLPVFSSAIDVKQALGALYSVTSEIRHALVHRRVEVDPSTLDLIGYDSSRVAHSTLNYDEQLAFCRIAQRIEQAISDGALRPRVEADIRHQLNVLQTHHGVVVSSNGSERESVRIIGDFPANGRIDVPARLNEARTRFQWARYVDLELRLPSGSSLLCELENAPQQVVTVNPTVLPNWIYIA